MHRRLPLDRALLAGLAAGLLLVPSSLLSAQHPLEGVEWNVEVIRPTGQLAVPVFEGWYQNPDGTYDLRFGYFNMNTEEVVEIPLGPDNFVEPAEYDGMQPTRFDPVPENGARRHWGVFTVRVPADFGDKRVTWTLRHRGKSFSVPGHIGSPHYILDALEAPARNTSAATMKLSADGPEFRGAYGMTAGPIQARAGVPVPLSVWVNPSPREKNLVWWFKHQGPGDVTFSQQESTVEGQGGEVRTAATFTEPGEYLLRVKAVEDVATIEFHCCWTNGYIRVDVAP